MGRRSADDFCSTLHATLVRVIGSVEGDARAVELARAVILEVSQTYQGEHVYIRRASYDSAAVLADYDGSNHVAVCRKHGISRTTLKRLVRARPRT